MSSLAAFSVQPLNMQLNATDSAQAIIIRPLPSSIAVCLMTNLPAEYIYSGANETVEPCIGISHKFGFYNIGWNRSSKKRWHTKEGLAKEIVDMVDALNLDAVGISEVFNLKDEHLASQRQSILHHLLESLNSSAGRPACSTLPWLAASATWEGRCDGHYLFAWNVNKLILKHYDYISCGIN